MKALRCLLLISTLIVLAAGSCWATDQTFRALLSGREEVPAVKTPATGVLILRLWDHVLTFELKVEGLASPIAAYIHKGKRGENGPPIAGLYGGPAKGGHFSGTLAGGELTQRNLLGELAGQKVADLVRLIQSGNAYVNVGSETFPAGEIRGQIQPSQGAPLTLSPSPDTVRAGE
ncbi:CHRD domain-containing protein [Geomonas sp.]|uniref:CHRD domain-containing protein n=1 Tax=Geomonas sp. TaxID=2651584 RepID=UPI002B498BBD|nr:CHRD domain-containing protein [Geomonas sp.]HJV36123.1 CHRD domain-containing protein [Geomonas sp.]